MKKYYFMMAAVSAMMLTACSSEDDLLLGNEAKQTVEERGVGFDVYLPGSTVTRGGHAGVMTTNFLKETGFGVFGYMTSEEKAYAPNDLPTGYTAATAIPNYMWNQQVSYNSINNGWYYAPLKYWPNETWNDSQDTEAQMPNVTTPTNIDRLTFFAYAPWVEATPGNGDTKVMNAATDADDDYGIVKMTATDGKISGATAVADPKIYYVVNTGNPNKSVDLLWGVAPVGNLEYTAVNKQTVRVPEGQPLLNLTKPAVNTNMKFLFQHALARLGLKVVLAADQVSAGGNFDFGSTKVTIEEIDIQGNFGVKGTLNLNNGTKTNVANWETVTKATGDNKLVIKGVALAEHLRYEGSLNTANKQQEHTGVTTVYSDVLQVSSVLDDLYNNYSKKVTDPAYSATTPYFANYTDNATTPTPTYASYNGWDATSGTGIKDATTNYYFYKTIMNSDKIAYTDISDEINVTYPKATFWTNDNIGYIARANVKKVVSGTAGTNEIKLTDATNGDTYKDKVYRKVGDVFVPTGQKAVEGDYVFDAAVTGMSVPKLTGSTVKYLAVPNYFMVIPTNWDSTTDEDEIKDNKTIKVKIKYWVSTKDANLGNGIVYTCNEVEKKIELPHLNNGVAYNLKLILGMTSVKLEAEVADWTTTSVEINLPQNTAE